MTEEEHILSMQYSYALGAKRRIIEFKNMLTDEDVIDIVNALVTFENSHLIANGFKDDKVAYALKDELEAALSKE